MYIPAAILISERKDSRQVATGGLGAAAPQKLFFAPVPFPPSKKNPLALSRKKKLAGYVPENQFTQKL